MPVCEALTLVHIGHVATSRSLQASRRCYHLLQVDWGRIGYGALPLNVGARGSKGCWMSTANAETLVDSERRTRPFNIVISTGDVMGDIHGAALVRELLEEAQRKEVEVAVYAVGGQRMKEAGAILIGDTTGLSSIGLLEAVPFIVPSIQLQLGVFAYLQTRAPDIVVLIDYPGVNIPFGRNVKKKFGCKVVYYIPPNEWLWNTSRTGAIVDMSDAILSVYPREAEYYRKAGGHIVEVGHPLLDSIDHKFTRHEGRKVLGLGDTELMVLLMPASRAQELRHVWPTIASAARLLLDRIQALGSDLQVRFIVPSILPGQDHFFEEAFQEHGLAEYARVWHGDSRLVMPAADVAITKSGSVNLELALFNVPQVVVYKIDAVTAWIAQNVFKFSVKHISLVNLILEEQVIPEFIQMDADGEKVAEAAFSLLPSSSSAECRERVLQGYQRLQRLLGKPGVARKTAQFVMNSVIADR